MRATRYFAHMHEPGNEPVRPINERLRTELNERDADPGNLCAELAAMAGKLWEKADIGSAPERELRRLVVALCVIVDNAESVERQPSHLRVVADPAAKLA